MYGSDNHTKFMMHKYSVINHKDASNDVEAEANASNDVGVQLKVRLKFVDEQIGVLEKTLLEIKEMIKRLNKSYEQ